MIEKIKEKTKNKKKILEYVITVAMVAILSVLAITAINNTRRGNRSIFGLQLYVVLSGSMSPTIKTGSVIILKPVEPEKIVQGDIITFSSKWNSNSLTTHRVVKVDNEKGLNFITKGDGNKVQDANPTYSENIKGKVILWIPYAGYIINFLKTPIGFSMITIIILLLIVINKLNIKSKRGT